MQKELCKHRIFWGYAAAFLNVSAGLVLLPVILRYMSQDDIGLWFVFITLGSFAQLLELGFQPTIARNVAYVLAGIKTLSKVGIQAQTVTGIGVDYQLLARLTLASKIIYRNVAGLGLAVMFCGGGGYIYSLLTPQQNTFYTLLGWFAFSAGYTATFYYGYINGILQGCGQISSANKITVLTKSVFIILGASSVIAGFGIVGLGMSSLLAAVIGRAYANKLYLENVIFNENGYRNQSAESVSNLIKILWHSASRLGLVQVGAFLIQRANILIASSILGLAQAASYGLTVTTIMVLSNISTVLWQIKIPTINHLQAIGDKKSLKSVYLKTITHCLSIFIIGFIVVIFAGNKILGVLDAKTMLLQGVPLLLLGIIAILELNHSIAATYITSTNEIPFVAAALFSGFLIITLSILSVSWFGVIGLIASQGIVQLLYNNWKWPCAVSEQLDLNIFKVITNKISKAMRLFSY